MLADNIQVPLKDKQNNPVTDKDGNPLFKWKKLYIGSSPLKALIEKKKRDYDEEKDKKKLGIKTPSDISFNDFCNKYLEYSRGNKSGSTPSTDERAIRNFRAKVPIDKLSELGPYSLEQFKAALKTEGRKPDGINTDLRVIKNLGSKAVDWEFWDVNKLGRVKNVPGGRSKKIRYLSPEECTEIVTKTKGYYKRLVMVGLFTGMRLSEMLHIYIPTDLHLSPGNSYVDVTEKENWHPKGYKFRRIYFADGLYNYLAEEIKQHKSEWLFARDDGKVPDAKVISAVFRQKICTRLGIDGFTCHCLRHTHSAYFLMQYKDIYGLSKRLGHSSVKTTESRYGFLLPGHIEEQGIQFKFPHLP
jgi:integrase